MKKIFKGYFALLLVIAMVFSYLPAYAAQTKSVTVHTQKELWTALKDTKVTTITISTNSKIHLMINDKAYYNKSLIIKAPNATIENNTIFKSVNVVVSSQKELDKVLANSDKLKVTTVTISTKKDVDIKFKDGDYSKIKLVVDAPNATVDTSNADFKSTTIIDVASITTPDPTTAPTTAPIASVSPIPTVAPTTTPSVDSGSTGGGFSGGGSSSGGGSYVPSNPSTPAPTVVPTVTPSTDELAIAKTTAISNIDALVEKYEPYLTCAEFFGEDGNGYNSGFIFEIKKEIAIINGYTNVSDVNNNSQAYIDSVNSVYANNQNYKSGNILFRNIVLPTNLWCTNGTAIVNGYYDFSQTNFDNVTRTYYVPVNDTSLVNNITFEDANCPTVVTGRAITYNIKAMNNVTINDVVGVYSMTDQSGELAIDDTLTIGSDYNISDSALTINFDTTGKPAGTYCFLIKTKVPYLNANTGDYLYVTTQ